jgi:Cytochrome c554 and c-prime
VIQDNVFLAVRILAVLLILSTADNSQAARLVDCSSCHGRINSEWRTSAHAGAYSSPAFLNEIESADSATRNSCTCHSPDFLVTGGIGVRPARRADSLHLGIDCIACHMDKEMVAWSDGEEWMVPHRVRSDHRYSQAVFCAGCHTWAKDMTVDCQDCHMPEEKGPVTDHPMFDRPADSGHRSHRMPGFNDPEFLAGAALLDIETAGERLEISLTNLVPVHAFPQISRRNAELKVMEKNGDRMLWNETVRLAADSTAFYKVEIPRDTKPLAVELRLYPAPAIWPDSSLLLIRKVVAGK